MLTWLARLIRDEMRSFASIAFFLVLAMSIGSAASWYEGGAARYTAAHTAHAETVAQTGYVPQEAASTTEAYLPPGVPNTGTP